MEFWTSVRVILRRWYVVVACVAIALVIGAVLVAGTKPTYLASGSLVFLEKSPENAPGEANTNPYKSLNAGTNGFANLMARVIDDPAFRDRVVADGGNWDYSITPPVGQTSVLGLSMTDLTPDAAIKSYAVLVADLRAEMQARQERQGSDQNDLYSAADLTVPSIATAQTAARTKVIIMVAGIGLFVALGLAFLVDSIANARARRPAHAADATDLLAVAPLDDPPANGTSKRDEGLADDDPLKALLAEAKKVSSRSAEAS